MSDSPSHNLQQAWQLYHLRRYPLALRATIQFLGQHPEHAEAYSLLALIHGKEKQKAPAYDAARDGIHFAPDWSYAHYAQALVAYWFEEYGLARKALSEALRIEPNNPSYLELLAILYLEQGHPHTALQVVERGLMIAPEHTGCLSQLGMTFYALNSHQEAEEAFRQVLRLDAEDPLAQGFMGHYELGRGDYRAALPHLQRALQVLPEHTIFQQDWKEAVAGSHYFYGRLNHFFDVLFDKFFVHWIAAVSIVMWPFTYMIFAREGDPDLIKVSLASIIFGGVVASLLCLLILGCMNLIQRILMVIDPQLNRTWNIKAWVRQHWLGFSGMLLLITAVMVGIVIRLLR